MSTTRNRLPAKERELQILHAATKVFARSNYRLASTAEIAAEAGIAEPTIYRYFPSKKDLFLRILDRVGKRILEVWDRVADTGEPDGLSTLERMGRAYFSGLRTHSDELKVQFQALAESDDPDIGRQLRENHEGFVRAFARVIQRGREDGSLCADVDPGAVAWLLNSVGFAMTLVRLLGVDEGERQGEAMMEVCLKLLAAGD